MNATFKSDNNKSPQCVYNEQIAINLAQVHHILNAMEVLTHTAKEYSSASLEIAKLGIPLSMISLEQLCASAMKPLRCL